MAGIDSEIRMTIKVLAAKGCSKAEMAPLPGLPESNVGCRRKSTAAGPDRSRALKQLAAIKRIAIPPPCINEVLNNCL